MIALIRSNYQLKIIDLVQNIDSHLFRHSLMQKYCIGANILLTLRDQTQAIADILQFVYCSTFLSFFVSIHHLDAKKLLSKRAQIHARAEILQMQYFCS